MRRIFESHPITDLLLDHYSKATGQKIGSTIDNAVRCWFLPKNETLLFEATYLLEREVEGNMDERYIRTAISRGIRWLSKYPIKDCKILERILAHYSMPAFDNTPDNSANPFVLEMFERVAARIKEHVPSFNPNWYSYSEYAAQILRHWDIEWNDPDAYDVISTIVYICEPRIPFAWHHGVDYLKQIEIYATAEHGIQ